MEISFIVVNLLDFYRLYSSFPDTPPTFFFLFMSEVTSKVLERIGNANRAVQDQVMCLIRLYLCAVVCPLWLILCR